MWSRPSLDTELVSTMGVVEGFKPLLASLPRSASIERFKPMLFSAAAESFLSALVSTMT